MNMKQELQNHFNKGVMKRDRELTQTIQASVQKLLDNNVGGNALNVGEQLPEATLINATNESISIYDYLKKGPLIISFYRGSWCPYCNIELRAYKELLAQIREAGADFIAVSPELPDNSMTLIEKQELEFDVLSDIDNRFAKTLGLVFRVDDALLEADKNFSHKLDVSQGNTSKEIPIPATYVIDRDGTVILAHIDPDYSKRLDPLVALKAITG